MAVYCQHTYFNMLLTYYVLVNEVNNEIHNLLQFTILNIPKIRISIHLSPICTSLFKNELCRSCQSCFFSTDKALQFYMSSNMAVSGNTLQWIGLRTLFLFLPTIILFLNSRKIHYYSSKPALLFSLSL